ncbi:MAG: energy transducer TonB [Pyrinomonadaceae bacterium]
MKANNILVRNPLGKRVFLALVLLASLAIVPSRVFAQESRDPAKTEAAETSVQVRIERARALAAAHKLEAAVRELESLRSTAADEVVHNVTSVMLMSIYLEEGNYTRAESLLEETFRARGAQKERSIRTYFALAGQAVNGARTHIARYRNFGIDVSDSGLPAEALADLDRMRSLLERMITQAREISKDDSRAYDSLALLEDVLGIRLSLAREGEDNEKWANEYAGARRGLSSSQKQVASLGGMPSLSSLEVRSPAAGKAMPSIPRPAEAPAPKTPQQNTAVGPTEGADPNTLSVGSLNHWATKRVVPVYPQLAKASGIVGVVRVYVTTDTDGRVIGVSNSEGPPVLKQAAEFAARQWRFQPAIVADKRFGLTGFIEFNFTL